MIDEWVQGGVEEVSPEYPAALTAGRFDHLPEAKRAVEAGLRGESALLEATREVFDAYVVSYLKELLRFGEMTPQEWEEHFRRLDRS